MCGGPSLAAIAPIVAAVAPSIGAIVKGAPAAPQAPAPAPVAPKAPETVEPEGVLDQERLRARSLRRAAQGQQRRLISLNQEGQSSQNKLLGS